MSIFILGFVLLANSLRSNIVTHHAEDGSGIGSAIVAGMLPFSNLVHYMGSQSIFSNDESTER